MIWLRLSLLPLVVVSLAACGWHLRGSAPADPALDGMELTLSSRVGTGELYREVRDALQAAGVILVPARAGVPVVLLRDERTGQRTIAGGRRALVQENELRYEMDWELLDGRGQPLMDRETYRQVRYYRAEQERELASRSRRDQLLLELRHGVAEMLTTQVRATLAADAP